MRKTVFLGVLAIAISAPVTAYAGCGYNSGAYNVSCENRVKVYRHKAGNIKSVGPSLAQAKIKIAKMEQETAMAKIAAKRAMAAEKAALKEKALANQNLLYRRTTQPRYYSNRARYGYRLGAGTAVFTSR